MNIYQNAEASQGVMSLDVDSRATFISRTYGHLLGAIFAFTFVEILLFQSGMAEAITRVFAGNWLIVFGGFMVVSWIASRAAAQAKTLPVQYAALGGFIVAEALIFCPILFIADTYFEGVITSAAVLALAGFTALSAIVFVTRKDFSFLRGILMWAGIGALITILCAFFFNFQLGAWFSGAMILVAGAAILYDTSNVLHHYPEDRYVSASLQLFASVALLFWYLLQLLMSLSRE